MLSAEGFRGLLVLVSLVVGLFLGDMPQPASAHGDGEDAHAEAPATPGGGSLGPRIAARSGDFELVGIARGRTLSIYLDRFADNQPVLGAKLDVEVDGQAVPATADPSGVYTVTANWVAQAGRHEIVFTILSDQGSDLLAGTLNVPSAPAATKPSGNGGGLPAPSIDNIFAFLLGMVVSSALFRRSSLTAIVRGAAARVRGSGQRILGAANDRFGHVEARLRQAVSVASAQLVSGAALPDFRTRRMPPSLRSLDWAAPLKSLRDRFDQAVLIPAKAVRPRRADGVGDSEDHPQRRAVAATVPIRVWLAGGRVEASTVAVICLVALVAIALLLIGRGVLAHEGPDEGPAGDPAQTAASGGDGTSGPHRLLDGSLFVPKDTQRLLNLRTTIARTSQIGRTLRVVGQVIPDPGTSGEIHATIRGRLQAFEGAWPKVGQKVEAGEVLAWVVPVVNPIDRGIILQQVAQIDHEIGLAQQRVTGLSVADSEASPREVDDARSDLANLSRRREAIAAVVRDRDTLRAPLLAPSSGIIAASFAVAGQVVDEQQKLFQVVDLKRLWVEAYAYDVAAIGKVIDANAQGSAGGNYHLKFISRGPQLQRQTIPLYFQIDNPDAGLSVGSLVSVLVETSGERAGVVLPRTAVTRNTSGQDIVWQHAYPESFVPIPVRVESIDGRNVLVTAGVAPNMRVVTEAADLLNEVR
jgi:hypothetical protein